MSHSPRPAVRAVLRLTGAGRTVPPRLPLPLAVSTLSPRLLSSTTSSRPSWCSTTTTTPPGVPPYSKRYWYRVIANAVGCKSHKRAAQHLLSMLEHEPRDVGEEDATIGRRRQRLVQDVLEACVAAGDVVVGVRLFNRLVAAKEPLNGRAAAVMLEGCRRSPPHYPVAEQLYTAMVTRDVDDDGLWPAPTERHHRAIIPIFSGRGAVDSAWDVYTRCRAEAAADGRQLDERLYAATISAVLPHDQARGLSVCRHMAEDRVQMTSVTATALMSQQHWKEAISVFRALRDVGAAPDRYSLTALLCALVKGSAIPQAFVVAKNLRSLGLTLDTVAYNVLLSLAAKEASPDGALNLLRDMRHAGVAPDVISYTTVLSCLARARRGSDGRRVVAEAVSGGLRPDRPFYCAAMQLFAASKSVSDAVEFHVQFSQHATPSARVVRPAPRKLPLRLNDYSYSTLLRVCASVPQMERAVDVLADMLQRGLQPGRRSVYAFCMGCLTANQFWRLQHLVDAVVGFPGATSTRYDTAALHTALLRCEEALAAAPRKQAVEALVSLLQLDSPGPRRQFADVLRSTVCHGRPPLVGTTQPTTSTSASASSSSSSSIVSTFQPGLPQPAAPRPSSFA